MKCIYYPGCSGQATAKNYNISFQEICKKLAIELVELDDWNCCGTTAAISINKTVALSLSARNLALASNLNTSGLPIITPCPSCSLSLMKVNKVIAEGGEYAKNLQEALGAGNMSYDGSVAVRHVLDFLINTVGVEKIASQVVKPLTGLRIAPYYGCLVTRPYSEGDDAQHPENMEKLIRALGGEPVDFPLKTTCCGGTLMITKKDVTQQMTSAILNSIKAAEAEIIATPCGLCQSSLELAQMGKIPLSLPSNALPVVNIAQLIGVAFGFKPGTLMLNRDIFNTAYSTNKKSACC